jgi:hypothetical protein
LKLWSLLDEWVTRLSPEVFTEILPLLRRTFATFENAERRQMGDLVRNQKVVATAVKETSSEFNYEAARRTLPILRQILGLPVSA